MFIKHPRVEDMRNTKLPALAVQTLRNLQIRSTKSVLYARLPTRPSEKKIIPNLASLLSKMLFNKRKNTMLKHFIGTAKEQFFYHNTLLCLVKALEKHNITVDLRNDSHVCGEVIVVDGFMNITFGTAVFVDAKGNEFAYNNLFISGRNIRYIHIPEDMAARDTIEKELLNVAPKPRNQNEPVRKSRKAKKALKLHMETVARL